MAPKFPTPHDYETVLKCPINYLSVTPSNTSSEEDPRIQVWAQLGSLPYPGNLHMVLSLNEAAQSALAFAVKFDSHDSPAEHWLGWQVKDARLLMEYEAIEEGEVPAKVAEITSRVVRILAMRAIPKDIGLYGRPGGFSGLIKK